LILKRLSRKRGVLKVRVQRSLGVKKRGEAPPRPNSFKRLPGSSYCETSEKKILKKGGLGRPPVPRALCVEPGMARGWVNKKVNSSRVGGTGRVGRNPMIRRDRI